MRCRKRGDKCQGYEKHHVFIYQTAPEQTFSERPPPQDLRRTDQLVQRVMRPSMTLNNSTLKREQIISSYMNVYFPDDITGSAALDPWWTLISGVSELPGKPIMLEKALAATSCIFFGKTNNDEGILKYGLQLYNGAIQHMSHQLSRKEYSDELFYTIGVFQVLVVSHFEQLPTYSKAMS